MLDLSRPTWRYALMCLPLSYIALEKSDGHAQFGKRCGKTPVLLIESRETMQ